MAKMVLAPGFWLGAWAWDEVAGELRRRGDEVVALTLPGLDAGDPGRLDTTLVDQAHAIVAAAPEPVVLVAHSGAALPAYLATDLAPERFSRVIYVDTAPLPDGFVAIPALGDAPEFPLADWSQVEADGNSLEGLDEAALARFRERAVPVPAGVAGAPLKLSDSDARLSVPTTLVCTSWPSEVVRQGAQAGQVPIFAEVARFDTGLLDYVDLPTGHWPMWSKPVELAEILHEVANR
ncbi:alpha/beta fold hydrolase [Nocardia sp. IFM 10818]